MRRLNFPSEYTFDLREIDGHREILDPLHELLDAPLTNLTKGLFVSF